MVPLALVGIELVSTSTRVTSVKSAKPLSVRENRTHGSDQGYLGPIKRLAGANLAPRSPSKAKWQNFKCFAKTFEKLKFQMFYQNF